MIAAVEVRINGRKIGLAAQAGDLAIYSEDRMCNLTGHHVDLVRVSGGDDHIGIARTGAVEHIGIAGKTSNSLDIQRIGGPAHEIGVAVDNGYVVALS